MAAVKLHDNDPRTAGRASGRGTAFACQISTSASGTGRASWSSTRPTSARRSPRSNSGSSSESSGPASLGRGWWLRRCDCSGSPRLLKRQLPAWPTRRSCLAPSIFARRSLSPKCSGGPFSRGHGGPFSCCRYHRRLRRAAGVAQRRPGREPRRHGRARLALVGFPLRSTKAGARTPATPAVRQSHPRDGRRSTKAGARTPATLSRPSACRTREWRFAQRRPGREPRRHFSSALLLSSVAFAQRRPGREPRRHAPWRRDRRRPARPLNEGRGANPGDTRGSPHSGPMSTCAQRRPGREPRRHLDRSSAHLHRRARSTKAGARTPATPARGDADRHGLPRSTKAGARTPATRRRRPRPGPSSSRSTKAGARTPATHARRTGRWAIPRIAQRRPGREPRRHMCCSVVVISHLLRSTKAGARTPATPPRSRDRARCYARSTKAGARTPATPRRQQRQAQRPVRSTKAGARTPATHARAHRRDGGVVRSTKAGARTPATLAGLGRTSSLSLPAQRRPGREPRRHSGCFGARGRRRSRSTKAGARTPATPARRRRDEDDDPRSTKAGARTPATRKPP